MSETQKGAARAEETRAEQVPACGRAAELDALADTLFGGHEALEHADEQEHHHHTHAPASHHEHGHHLLQVEDLSVGFRMYDEDAPFFRARQRFVPVIELPDHLGACGRDRGGGGRVGVAARRFWPTPCWACSSRTPPCAAASGSTANLQDAAWLAAPARSAASRLCRRA